MRLHFFPPLQFFLIICCSVAGVAVSAFSPPGTGIVLQVLQGRHRYRQPKLGTTRGERCQRCTSSRGSRSNAALSLSAIIKVYHDSTNYLHRDVTYHPEQPARIDACVDLLWQEAAHEASIQKEKEEIRITLRICDVSPTSKPKRVNEAETTDSNNDNDNDNDNDRKIHHEPFTEAELEHAQIMLTQGHTAEYVTSIKEKCRSSRQRRIDEGKDPLGFVGYVDDGGDTYLTTESYDVLLRATAAWIRCVDDVMTRDKGDTDDGNRNGRGNDERTAQERCTAAMALTRPPGHHATTSTPNGFCIFNFAAAAAIHAIQSGSAQRVSILDWDVHYGQGVADIVQRYDNIRYASMHQYPAFPYMGAKRGISGRHGNILTVPLPPESTWTCGYSTSYRDIVLPFVYDEGVWEPDLIIVCAGYDALNSDELASCSLNAADYGTMTMLLREHLASGGDGDVTPIIFGLEGGYQLKEGAAGGNLQEAVLETLRSFA